MTDERPPVDNNRCPICGELNECAIAAGRSPESCWCMTVSIDPDVLASIPSEAEGKVCICATCAAGAPFKS